MDGNDVRVVEGGGGAGLPQEPRAAVWVGGSARGQHLERNQPVEEGVAGLVHHPHPTLADLLEYLVVRERLADHG